MTYEELKQSLIEEQEENAVLKAQIARLRRAKNACRDSMNRERRRAENEEYFRNLYELVATEQAKALQILANLFKPRGKKEPMLKIGNIETDPNIFFVMVGDDRNYLWLEKDAKERIEKIIDKVEEQK